MRTNAVMLVLRSEAKDLCAPSGFTSGDSVTYIHTSFEFIALFLCAPPLATQFSAVQAPTGSDPCQFFSFHHIISVGTPRGYSVFCSVEDFVRLCACFWVSLGLSGPLCASLCSSQALWASLGLSGTLRASLGLCRPLWASLGLSNKNKTIHNQHTYVQLETQFSLGPEVARRKDHTICPRQLEPLCPSRLENCKTKRPDNTRQL